VSIWPEHPQMFGEPGYQYRFWYPAMTFGVEGAGMSGKGVQRAVFRESFSQGAFDSVIDQVVPVRFEERIVGWDRIIAAEVAEDGSGVTFTCEIINRVSKEE
jgi:hypothetical protein